MHSMERQNAPPPPPPPLASRIDVGFDVRDADCSSSMSSVSEESGCGAGSLTQRQLSIALTPPPLLEPLGQRINQEFDLRYALPGQSTKMLAALPASPAPLPPEPLVKRIDNDFNLRLAEVPNFSPLAMSSDSEVSEWKRQAANQARWAAGSALSKRIRQQRQQAAADGDVLPPTLPPPPPPSFGRRVATDFDIRFADASSESSDVTVAGHTSGGVSADGTRRPALRWRAAQDELFIRNLAHIGQWTGLAASGVVINSSRHRPAYHLGSSPAFPSRDQSAQELMEGQFTGETARGAVVAWLQV